MKEKKEIKISLSTFFLILAIIIIVVLTFFIYKIYIEKEYLTNEVTNLNTQIENLKSSSNNTTNIIESNNANEDVNKLKEEIQTLNTKINSLENEKNNAQKSAEKEYSIEKHIVWSPNTKSYDFDTKNWRPNDTAEYYVATDKNNNLCIVNSKKKLVHKTDIILNKLIESAYCSSDTNILTIILEDTTAYDINITTFKYTKYKYASGY